MSKINSFQEVSNIFGGSVAADGRFPFVAAVLPQEEDEEIRLCSGTLIAPNVVLLGEKKPCLFSLGESLKVVLGCNDITDRSKCEVLGVSKTIFLNNDITMLILQEESKQEPITLALPGFELEEGQDVTISGWGKSNPITDEGTKGVLREARVELVDLKSCLNQYANVLALLIFDADPADSPTEYDNSDVQPIKFSSTLANLLCASADGRDACEGDEGGPLLLRCDATGVDVQVGFSLHIEGIGCGFNGLPAPYFSLLNNVTAANEIKRVVEDQGHQLKTIEKFTDFCNVGGTQPLQEFSDPPTSFPTFNVKAWTCNPKFFAVNDACDCNCGIPDPDCELDNSENVRNCASGEICVDALCVSEAKTDIGAIAGVFVGVLVLFGVVGAAIWYRKGHMKISSQETKVNQTFDVKTADADDKEEAEKVKDIDTLQKMDEML